MPYPKSWIARNLNGVSKLHFHHPRTFNCRPTCGQRCHQRNRAR